jgi:hypothetical protein
MSGNTGRPECYRNHRESKMLIAIDPAIVDGSRLS